MPTELLGVTEIARDFLIKSGHLFFQPEKADFDQANRRWVLLFNVGISNEKLKKVVIDEAGKVVGFE